MNLCSFDPCNNETSKAGLCWSHYRMKRKGEELRPLRAHGRQGCDFPECDGKHMAQGYCATHYNQLREGRELTPIVRKMRNAGECSDTKCSEKAQRRGMCRLHYDRWYYEQNSEKERQNSQARRLLEEEAGLMPETAKRDLEELYGALCLYPECQESESLQIDHVVPLTKGGTNSLLNLQLLCPYHNGSKGNYSSVDYRPALIVKTLEWVFSKAA